MLYRELGTLQQLSYATDAVAELRTVETEVQRLREGLQRIYDIEQGATGNSVSTAMAGIAADYIHIPCKCHNGANLSQP